MICPICNTDNRDGAKFCDECGQRLIDAQPAVQEPIDQEVLTQDQQVDMPLTGQVDTGADDFGDDVVDDEPASSDVSPDDDYEEPQPSPLSGLDVSVPIIFDPVPLNRVDDAAITREIPVVGSGYTKPENAWKTGGTLEMPRVEVGDAPGTTDFRAPDPNDRKNRKRQAKELRKQQKAAERAARAAEGKPTRPTGPIVLIVLLVAAVLIAGGTYMLEMWGGKTVPDVSGKTEADAQYILENAGFTVRHDTVPSDDTEGLVLMSDPTAGSRIEPGTEVLIHVATARVIPDVAGLPEAEALAALTKAGYTNTANVVYEKSDESDGIALKIEPEPGTKTKSGTKVTLTVSQAYTVPEVDSLSEAAAYQAVVDAGLTPSISYVQNPDAPEGFAFAVDPAAGSKVKSGSTVTISIATSRATELVKRTTAYLQNCGALALPGGTIGITSVDACTYDGNGVVSFTVTGNPVLIAFGQTFYGAPVQVSGRATFDDSDQLLSVG